MQALASREVSGSQEQENDRNAPPKHQRFTMRAPKSQPLFGALHYGPPP